MAVTSSKLLPEGWIRTGADSYQAIYRVTTDDAEDGPETVLAGARTGGGATPDAVPAEMSTYSLKNDSNASSYATRFFPIIKVAEKDNLKKWNVTVGWNPLDTGTTPLTQDQIDNPLTRPTEWSIDFESTVRIVTHDRGGEQLANILGQPYDVPLEVPDYLPILVARKNIGTLAEIVTLNRQYMQRTNSTPWLGHVPGRWLCRPITTAGIEHEKGVSFYPVQFQFVFRERTSTQGALYGWEEEVAQTGYVARDAPNTGNKKVDADDFAIPTRALVALKVDGTPATDAAGQFSLLHDVYYEADFNQIGLGSPGS